MPPTNQLPLQPSHLPPPGHPMDNIVLPPGMMPPQPQNNTNNNNNFFIPDLSRPPPGFGMPGEGGPPIHLPTAQEPPPPVETAPATPYFNLPAGLMAPFIRLEDCSYKPLDPDQIVLPPPTPPSERLMLAVESFYSLPSHERPRDGDGWEKLALYEYYKVKNQARRQKEEAIRLGERDKSRSPSPIVLEAKVKKAPKRRYRSVSKSPEPPNQTNQSVNVSSASLLVPDDEGDEAGDRVKVVLADRSNSSGRRRERSRSRERPGGRSSEGRGSGRHSRDRRSDSPAYDSGSGGGRSDRSSRGRPRDISPPSTPVIG